jgi:hypothetical protein
MISFILPSPISSHLQGLSRLELTANTLQVMVTELREQYPKVYGVLFTPQGTLNGFVNIYLNQERVSDQLHTDRQLPDGAVLEVVVSVSGG